jgi:hypothetical protein
MGRGGRTFGNYCGQAFGTSSTAPGREVTISYVFCDVRERKMKGNFENMLSRNKATTHVVLYPEGPWAHKMGQGSPSYYGVIEQVPCC